jgi:ribonuclease R
VPTVIARFRPHPKGFGFATPVGPDTVTPTAFQHHDGTSLRSFDSIFIPPPVAAGRLSDDLIEVEVEVDEKGASATEGTLKQRPTVMLVGTIAQGPGRLVVEPDRAVGGGWVELEPAAEKSVAQAVGRQVVVMIGQAEDGAPIGRALVAGPHVVGSPAAVRAAAVVIALNRAAPSLIPGGPAAAGLDPAATEATAVRIVGMLAGGRRGGAAGLDGSGEIPGHDMHGSDRRDDFTVTIDDTHTRDVDDAISATWSGDADAPVEIAVHIADAAAAVGLGSPADQYARTMASTAYLTVGDNAPMLDPALAEDALSLLPGVERGALSLRCFIQPDGAITDVEVELAVVESDAKLSYAAVEQWLDGDAAPVRAQLVDPSSAAALDETLHSIREAATRLGVERDGRNTIEALFTQAEIEPAILDGKLRTRPAEPHAAAYRLVERLMVAANESVAGWLVEHDVPALYRAHAGLKRDALPKLRAAVALAVVEIEAFEAADDDVNLDAALTQLINAVDAVGEGPTRDLLGGVIAGSIARASYEPDPAAHRGLASDAYVHFTSPIRRYADLVVHRQIRAALAGETPPHAADELGPLARWLDARAGAATYAGRRERDDLWTIILDRGFVKGTEEAVVAGLTPNGIRVRFPRLGVTGFLMAERVLGTPKGERGNLEVDEHGLTTTSGPWQVGTHMPVEIKGRDFSGRLDLRLPR